MIRWPVAATVLVLAAGAVRADPMPPLSAEQAKSLGHAIRLWSSGLVAGDVGDTPGYSATPADGHYDVEVPVAGRLGADGPMLEGSPVTMKATPRDAGAWALDDVTMPSPLRLVVPPGKDSKRLVVEQTLGEQTSNVLLDPTLLGRTSADTVHGHWSLRVDDGRDPVEFTAAKTNTHVEWAPSTPGHVDTAVLTRMDGVAVRGPAKDSPAVTVRTVTSTLQSADADPDRASTVVRRAMALASKAASAPDREKKLTPEERAAVHDLLHMARDLARESKQALEAEGLSVSGSGHTVGIDKLSIAQKAAAPDGKMDFTQRFEMTGLHVSDLPPGPMRDFVPHHLVLAPHVSGVVVDDVFAMLDRVIDDADSKPDSLAADAQAMLAKAPVTAGLDELAFDVGPATLTAHGSVTASGPQDVDGTATVETTGLDALIKKAGTQKTLKQGVPVLIFLKGIGEQQGDRVVWNIAYKGGQFTVNGTDMSNLIPGGK